jgi:cytoplasmic membrane protein
METNLEILKNIKAWSDDLKDIKMAEIFKNGSQNIAFICVDMINAFCKEGALSSTRIGGIANKLTNVFDVAYTKFGLRNFILIQDCHTIDSAEFQAFVPHALSGTNEADTIEEIKNLFFFDEIKIFYKNSISSAYCNEFNKFLSQNPKINTFVIFGNCTDICLYQLGLHLKLQSGEINQNRKVIVAENLAQTYDAPWHNGDFYHIVFLHHLQMVANVEVYKKITF